MFAICAFGVPAVQAQTESKILVQHVRPSAVLEDIKQLTPQGTSLIADDNHGWIIVKGDKNAVASMIALFDVEPRPLKIMVTIQSPIDHASGQFTASAANNRQTRFADASTGVDLSLVPRVNADGTVTFHLTASYRSLHQDIVVRRQSGQAYSFSIGKPSGPGELADPTISVTATIGD